MGRDFSGIKKNKWFFAFLGMAVVCVLLVTVLIESNSNRFDGPVVEVMAPGPNQPDDVPVESTEGPSIQGADVASKMPSVQSVDSVQAVVSGESHEYGESLQSVQGAAGIAIADIGQLELADLAVRGDLPGEWRNILLLGSDSRDMKTVSLCDTIIIASVNKNTGELKLTSILRDTVVPITGRGMGRINTAAYYGGPSLMIKTINQSFGMNITEYVLVNFRGMAKAIDALGGINLNISQDEMDQINLNAGQIAKYTMDEADYLAAREAMKLKAPGDNVQVNGIQAVTFARIRSIDSDAARAGRQRMVIARILEKLKSAQQSKLLGTAAQIWGDLVTNIDIETAVELAKIVQGGQKGVLEFTIPYAEGKKSDDGALIDVDLAANTRELHNFIYGPMP